MKGYNFLDRTVCGVNNRLLFVRCPLTLSDARQVKLFLSMICKTATEIPKLQALNIVPASSTRNFGINWVQKTLMCSKKHLLETRVLVSRTGQVGELGHILSLGIYLASGPDRSIDWLDWLLHLTVSWLIVWSFVDSMSEGYYIFLSLHKNQHPRLY